ncbi:MAG: FAD-dependent oxidoreductase [Deltaproteobacteria bacterium]|nr:FAD-dependent oxidoreductase [Deltaproteobacteria bacterium]MCW8892934.1 FAD-dependent oxidoreductase [Deltaproteobacteria bacterium]
MKKKLVIAGGGHAHLLTLARLRSFIVDGHEVTVIGPSEYHYYSGMGPGMLGNTYSPEEIRFATKKVTENMGATFTLGKLRRIDPETQRVQLSSGDELPYDVLSCNLGSQVPEDLVTGPQDDVFLVKPIEELLRARQRILELGHSKKIAVGVVGGGASAVEVAGNIWRLGREPGMNPIDIILFPGSQLLPHHPDRVRRMADSSLRKRNIRVEESCRVQTVETGRVIFETGGVYDLDIIFVAVGIRPSTVFRESGIATGPDGGMLVNRYLQSTTHPTIFGGGDCIYFADAPLDKVGVYAVRQNPVLYHNLRAALRGTALQPFAPGGRYMLIFNMGDDTGVFYKWPLLFGGHAPFLLKNYIDRKFMKNYQTLE